MLLIVHFACQFPQRAEFRAERKARLREEEEKSTLREKVLDLKRSFGRREDGGGFEALIFSDALRCIRPSRLSQSPQRDSGCRAAQAARLCLAFQGSCALIRAFLGPALHSREDWEKQLREAFRPLSGAVAVLRREATPAADGLILWQCRCAFSDATSAIRLKQVRPLCVRARPTPHRAPTAATCSASCIFPKNDRMMIECRSALRLGSL